MVIMEIEWRLWKSNGGYGNRMVVMETEWWLWKPGGGSENRKKKVLETMDFNGIENCQRK